MADTQPLDVPPNPMPDDNRARAWLALAVMAQFVALVGWVIYVGRTNDNQLVLGAEVSFVSSVLSYYFGSSSGSASKEALLAKK